MTEILQNAIITSSTFCGGCIILCRSCRGIRTRFPFFVNEDFECGITANPSEPSNPAYYLRNKVGDKIITANSFEKLIELAATDLHDGDLAIEWLLSRPYLALSGHGDWLSNTIRALYPDANAVITNGETTYIDPKAVNFDLSQLAGLGWVRVNDDGWLRYVAEHDKHFHLKYL